MLPLHSFRSLPIVTDFEEHPETMDLGNTSTREIQNVPLSDLRVQKFSALAKGGWLIPFRRTTNGQMLRYEQKQT